MSTSMRGIGGKRATGGHRLVVDTHSRAPHVTSRRQHSQNLCRCRLAPAEVPRASATVSPTTSETEECTVSDRFSVELYDHGSMAEHLVAGSSGVQDAVSGTAQDVTAALQTAAKDTMLAARRLERQQSRAREQTTYKIAAIAASTGVTAMAITAVYFRFTWNMRDGVDFPTLEAAATLLLTFGGVVGMEMWARWAHKVLWHENEAGWSLHKSHHVPRVGPFEANDIYAICNAVPAISLCLYGFLTPTLMGGVCFGAGLGITLFGIMYMFIHDGMVHRRFPVGPIADVPYLKRCAVAHQLHHSEKYGGVPWGMFLGPQELEAIGAKEELDRLCTELTISGKKK
ncbi:beta-carotene 3-hydroxylase, chloroplastic (Fragment) [Coccomyxa sp. Obi]